MEEGSLYSGGYDDESSNRKNGPHDGDNNNNTSGLSPASVAHTLSHNTDERLDKVWSSVEHDFANNNRRTSPPKSPLEEEDDHDALDEQNNNINSGDLTMNESLTSSSEYVSPLMMAHSESDLTLQISNKTSSSSLVPISINNSHTAGINCHGSSDHQHNTQQIYNNSNNKHQSLLQKYRNFLQKYDMSIDILESIMERFVFYGYLFKHDHHNISTEMYYAIWNSIRWFNDVVLVGWGEGMGLTLGRKDEWLISSSSSSSLSEAISLELNSIVPILRSVLTATTCLYPAMEAWSRRSTIYTPRSPLGTSRLIDNNGEEEAARRYYSSARVSYRLERVKFVARLALLSISWWARRNRHRKNKDDTHENDGERMSQSLMPSLLRRGGELDPYEQLLPLKDAEEESKVAQYVGRRTGRRSIARSSSVTSPSSFPSSSQLSCISPPCSSPFIANCSSLIKWLISKLTSSKSSIIYVYAVGELLHILRPLYWSHAESIQWHQQHKQRSKSSPKMSQKQSYSYAIWKAWFISLLMDFLSDKLLQLNVDSGDEQCSNRRKSGSGGRHSNQHGVLSSSAEQAKQDELNRRRSRHKLYLLRSPMYNAVTHPVATQLARVVSMIPSFGLGQWGAEYILDMMSYWNENHFMLES